MAKREPKKRPEKKRSLLVDGEHLEFLMKDMPRIYEGLKRVMES